MCRSAGFWRGSTSVAVKVIMSTPPAAVDGPSGSGDEVPALPARALAEAVLARDLSHPHVIQTYEVRTSVLGPAFCAALYKSAATTSISLDHLENPPTQQEVDDVIKNYNGLTPLVRAVKCVKHNAWLQLSSS